MVSASSAPQPSLRGLHSEGSWQPQAAPSRSARQSAASSREGSVPAGTGRVGAAPGPHYPGAGRGGPERSWASGGVGEPGASGPQRRPAGRRSAALGAQLGAPLSPPPGSPGPPRPVTPQSCAGRTGHRLLLPPGTGAWTAAGGAEPGRRPGVGDSRCPADARRWMRRPGGGAGRGVRGQRSKKPVLGVAAQPSACAPLTN